ncbi:ChuX/HutX family heme-like substrate-binding protein [Snodgrassella sp. ESL0253]|uniref:ChuX/HutX family heme-like substrate-binding protein n=1 Tax=Snodgrassella sp. ESL0253 TaxID=2705031 RepID=UPI001583D3A4|nr:ChuX/HutX family heme-like substrate-binding protein [Snodgrassella sp. ESL0253]NUE66290.1 hypothetical protein [Snodgrassella sp. ESL0253]
MPYQAMMAELIQAIADAVIIDGSQFNAVWQEVQTGNEMTFLLHTVNIIVGFSSALPAGKKVPVILICNIIRGSAGISARKTVYIAFVECSFMLMVTAAIIFLNWQGEIMFKIFAGRDKKRPLKAERLSSLAQRFGAV